MHEMSLAVEIRSICERELTKLPGKRLTGLGVDVGVFSGVEAETLRFCLEVVMADGFNGVRCEIRREPGVGRCLVCGREFEVRRAPFECPDCGVPAHGVSGGRALAVGYLEVE